MISKDFFKALDLIALEKGIEKEKILEIMGRGILNAYKKIHNTSENARIDFNEDKNEIMLSAEYEVVEEESLNPGEITLADARMRRKSAKNWWCYNF